jgi:putative tryptophan/tyrosine transport system substrate-binding protein
MIDRRRFLLTGTAALTVPRPVAAQTAGKVFRVGLIISTSPLAHLTGPDPIQPAVRALLHALRDRGYVEGRNLIVERRSAEGKFERLEGIAAELIGQKPDVIVAGGNNIVVQVLQRLTTAVPIVMTNSTDPVEAGIIASLARPGGNITGLTGTVGTEIEAKRLQLLKDALPDQARIGYLGTLADWESRLGQSVRSAATGLGVTLVHVQHTPTDYNEAFALIAKDRSHALFVSRSPANFGNRRRICRFCRRAAPASFYTREFVDTGGLMSYGVNIPDLFRSAAAYVDKILRGARPADLPVEQPTKFELVLNAATFKTLGLAIPPLLLARADEVIE